MKVTARYGVGEMRETVRWEEWNCWGQGVKRVSIPHSEGRTGVFVCPFPIQMGEPVFRGEGGPAGGSLERYFCHTFRRYLNNLALQAVLFNGFPTEI